MSSCAGLRVDEESSHKRLCPSVGPSVHPWVCPLVHPSVRGNELKSGKTSVLDSFCVWGCLRGGALGVDGG